MRFRIFKPIFHIYWLSVENAIPSVRIYCVSCLVLFELSRNRFFFIKKKSRYQTFPASNMIDMGYSFLFTRHCFVDTSVSGING